MSETWTTLKVLTWTADRFARAGIETPRLEAQILLAHTLSCDRVQLYVNYDQPLKPQELAAYRQLIKRRLDGQPVAYLVGEREFWSLPFHVDENVLIPRSDTETVIAVILDEIAATSEDDGDGEKLGDTEAEGDELPEREIRPWRNAPYRIADIATGSGAIAITLATELGNATVVASDRSPEAARIAADNAARNRVAERLDVRVGDLFTVFEDSERFDIIASNPPYIPTADLSGLAAEVRCEPREALDGGVDGLDILRRLVSGAGRYLSDGGLLVLEHGFDQAETVAELIAAAGTYDKARSRRDLGGNPRVTFTRKLL